MSWCDKERIAPPALWAPKNPPVEPRIDQAVQEDKTTDSKSSAVTVSDIEASQQREAAYARHQLTDSLKQDCIRYWLQHQNYSNDEAAGKFYKALPPERKKLLAETNAARTLSQAISQYRNREKPFKESKSPRWLANFNPKDPLL